MRLRSWGRKVRPSVRQDVVELHFSLYGRDEFTAVPMGAAGANVT
jgi:hypothetical protein